MLFNFRLRDVAAIAPFGGERPTLHWFGLSDGWYWLAVGESTHFTYHQDFMRREEPWRSDPAAPPAVDYYVVRLWEDLLEQLPAMLAPVPPALAERVADAEAWRAWQERAARWLDGHEGEAAFEEALDLADVALGWWRDRRLPTGYLRDGPRLWCWRVGDTVHLRWDNRDERADGIPVWAAQAGEATIPVDTFLAEVRDFDARFLAAMGARVAAVRAHWPHPAVAIDLDRLAREQRDRSTWLARSMARAGVPEAGAWRRVLSAIARIEREKLAPEA